MTRQSDDRVQCVILAGGLATRMRPLTEKTPKSLLPVEGQPFVDHQLKWLSAHGVTDVVFCVGYKGVMLRAFVGDGAAWGLRAAYVDEGEDLRGTGGALRKALDEGALAPEFLVLYGDSFLPVHFGAIYRHFLGQSRAALMTVFRNEGRWDSSNVCYKGGSVTLYDKSRGAKSVEMEFIDYGLSAFRRDLIAREIPSGAKQDLAGMLHRLSVQGELAGMEVKERFYEIGSPQGLEDFRALVRAEKAKDRR